MPHLTIEYSANVEGWTSIDELCDRLRREAIDTSVFPMAGVRVRAIPCEHYSIADGGPEHGFVDISVRVGSGRAAETKKEATRRLFDVAQSYLEDVIEQRSLALSMEMREIDPELSPKTGSIRKFLGGA